MGLLFPIKSFLALLAPVIKIFQLTLHIIWSAGWEYSRKTVCVLSASCLLLIIFLFIVFLTATVLYQSGLDSQPLRHGRYHGSALPAAILRDEEGDVTLGGEEAHHLLELLAVTTGGEGEGRREIFSEEGERRKN